MLGHHRTLALVFFARISLIPLRIERIRNLRWVFAGCLSALPHHIFALLSRSTRILDGKYSSLGMASNIFFLSFFRTFAKILADGSLPTSILTTAYSQAEGSFAASVGLGIKR